MSPGKKSELLKWVRPKAIDEITKSRPTWLRLGLAPIYIM
jgi:hypothetical protein